MPGYLDTEDTEMPFPPGYDPDEEERKRILAIPQVPGMAPSPAAAAAPDLSKITGYTPPPVAPGTPPVISDYTAARNALAEAKASAPPVPKPKWWQRLAAGAVGAATGYANAAGRTRKIDDTDAVNGILGGIGYDQKLADWKNRVNAAQAKEEGAEGNLNAWWKNRQLENQEALQQSEEERNRAIAKYNDETRAAGVEERRQTNAAKAAQAKDDAFTKKNPDWIYINPAAGEQAPEGWVTQPSAVDPSKLIAKPPILMQLTPDLAQYVPGRKVGDRIPYSEWKGAQAAAQKVAIEQQTSKPSKMDATRLAIIAAGGNPDDPTSITQEVAKRAMQQQHQGMAVQLTPDAVDFWAKYAGTTGQLPSLGMGQAGAAIRGQILNRAPELAGGDVAGNKAAYHADTTSLASLQKMRDAVVSFEKTAGANLDVFMNNAKKVIDSGSPLVNQPLRSINRNVLGDADLAAYDAARRIALNEIAKVTSNPALSGQLSDSARREIENIVPENATLGQLYRVAGVLRQDMANRHKFLDEGLTEIKGRMGGGGRGGQQGGGQSQTIRVRRKSDGATGTLDAKDFDPTKYERL